MQRIDIDVDEHITHPEDGVPDNERVDEAIHTAFGFAWGNVSGWVSDLEEHFGTPREGEALDAIRQLSHRQLDVLQEHYREPVIENPRVHVDNYDAAFEQLKTEINEILEAFENEDYPEDEVEPGAEGALSYPITPKAWLADELTASMTSSAQSIAHALAAEDQWGDVDTSSTNPLKETDE